MYKYTIFIILLTFICACGEIAGEAGLFIESPIYPAYENVTIPPNIAPLSFVVNTTEKEVKTVLYTKNYQVGYFGHTIPPFRSYYTTL